MPVPPEDMLCRFIPDHEKSWSKTQKRPRPPAFKENGGLSVWHIELLRQDGVEPGELRIGALSGYGEAHHTAGDYLETAREAADCQGVPLSTVVEWRTEDRYVKPDWREWAYAHVQVEHTLGPNYDVAKLEAVLVLFRQQLSKNARHTEPPDRYQP